MVAGFLQRFGIFQDGLWSEFFFFFFFLKESHEFLYQTLSSRRAGLVLDSCLGPLLAGHCKLNLGVRFEGRSGLAFRSQAWMKAGF